MQGQIVFSILIHNAGFAGDCSQNLLGEWNYLFRGLPILDLEQNGQYFTTYFGGELTPLITLTKAFVKSFAKRTVVNGISFEYFSIT